MAARRSWSLFERRRLPPESQLELGKRRVRLPPNLANLSPAGRAQDHESDVARDVKPCLYVVPPVAAHLCRPVVGCLGRPERRSCPQRPGRHGERAPDLVEETTDESRGPMTDSWRPSPPIGTRPSPAREAGRGHNTII